MHESDAHPFDHQGRGAAADFGKPLPVHGFGWRTKFGEMARDDVIGQAPEDIVLLVRGKDLEIAEAHE